MKNKFVLFFLLFVSTLSFAQVRVGVLAGGNLMTQNASPEVKDTKVSNLFAGHAGVLVSIPIVEGLSFQPGLNYQLKGCNVETTSIEKSDFDGVEYSFGYTITGNFKYHYIELPLNLSYAFEMGNLKITPYAGMYASYAMSANVEYTFTTKGVTTIYFTLPPTTITATKDIKFSKEDDMTVPTAKPFDYGSQFGVGFEFNKVFLRLQYSLGFADIDRIDAPRTTTNNGFGLSIGYWIKDGSGNSNKGKSK